MLWPVIRQEGGFPSLEIGSLHRSLDNLLADFFGGVGMERRSGLIAPQFEVSETDGSVMVEAELPGMDEKDIEISVTDHVLTIQGEKKKEAETKKKNYYIAERSYGRFQRSLQLGSGVDTDKVRASFKNGVLTVTLPKTEPEKSKTRKIDIQAD